MDALSIKKIERRQVWRILISSILCGAGALGLTLMSLYQGYMIDAAAAADTHSFIRYALGVLCSIAFYWIGNVFGGKFSSKYVGVCSKLIKQSLMYSIIGRSLACFRKKDDAYYLNLLTNDMNIIQEGRLSSVPSIVYCIVLLVSCLTALIFIQPLMIIASVASALPGFIIPTLLSKKLQRSKDMYSQSNETLTLKIKEGIEGNESIQLSGGEEGYLKEFDKANDVQENALVKSRFTTVLNSESVQAASSLGSFAAVLVGCFCLMGGQLSYGMMNSSIMLSSIMILPVVLVASKLGELLSAKNISKKIDEELSEEIQPPINQNMLHENSDPSIRYESVSFGFTDTPLFENMSVDFSGKGCYLITGESGCGKSTLIKLLLKYYDSYTGRILLNGMDIRDIPDKTLYSQIGIIEQAPYFFNDSIKNNITLFSDGDEDCVERIIQKVNLTDLYKNHGDDCLGDFGDSISGGERRRLSIARALVKTPSILIFDEPTSGLDVENAKKINDLIFSLDSSLRIVISHERDQSYIQRFDWVIEL